MAGKGIIAVSVLILLAACSGPSPEGLVRVDATMEGPVCEWGLRIAPGEVPGNLSAELVRNQDFEDGMDAWEVQGGDFSLTREYPMMNDSPVALCVSLPEGGDATISCSGFGGMSIQDKQYYYLRFNAAWGDRFDGELAIRLKAADGRILCNRPLYPDRDSVWCEYSGQLTAEGSAPDARLEIIMKGKGRLLFDYISLMPFATFNRRINGMRPDAAQALKTLSPAFLRWDGGNGWKRTEGDPRGRTLFGIQEFFELAQDLDASAHLAFVGKPVAKDVEDAADYALGDGTTFWSRQRILQQSGSFPLTWLEADEPVEADIPYDVPFTGSRTAVIPARNLIDDAIALMAMEPTDTMAVPDVLFSRMSEAPALIHTTTDAVYPTPSYTAWQVFLENKPDFSLAVSSERVPDDCYFTAGYDSGTKEIVLKMVNGRMKPVTCTWSLDGIPSVSRKGKVLVIKEDNLVPRAYSRNRFGNRFNHTLPPRSLSILRIPAS